ncbi:dihydrouridine synthase domain containing protein [Danaus plexippus plexippus]|uniref:Dihydrouridine synthase domain containing protein n=1 Tax=Danaus plexippus plexippus TaxID=278856 RepID=A0A212EVC2_DANPL|nr:dihydrouridine synthase domain containing protein [Danaus plexippus plexippus]
MSDEEDSNPKPVKLLISTESLIGLIKEKPCLWDKTDVGYRYRPTREQAWVEIYKKVYPDYDKLKKNMKVKIGQQISKKWFNVRDAYVKSIKDSFRKPYLHSEMLSFINPFIVGGTQNESVFLDEPYEGEESDHWMQEDSFVSIEEEPIEKKPKIETQKVEVEINPTSDSENFVSVLTKLLSREEDEDRAFFTSITPVVKTLSVHAKLEFKADVIKLLNEAKKRDTK